MMKTATSTIARARFAVAGGSPKGCHATKTSTAPTRRMDPKPLKQYPKICRKRCVGGGEGVFLPYSISLLLACSVERPWLTEVDRRLYISLGVMRCQSRLASSLRKVSECIKYSRLSMI